MKPVIKIICIPLYGTKEIVEDGIRLKETFNLTYLGLFHLGLVPLGKNPSGKGKGIRMKLHNKLVRDKIPEIIEKSGKTAVIHILGEADYIKALDIKLNEEVAEYQASKSLEEMADILEVLQTICVLRGYSLEQLEEKRKEKTKERGGFQNRVYLEATTD